MNALDLAFAIQRAADQTRQRSQVDALASSAQLKEQQRGPGTELKKLLARFGIVASPTCGCNAMAARMDAAGPDGSEAMLPEILAVMRTEAEKRGLPFIEAAARLLVKKAIRTARAAG